MSIDKKTIFGAAIVSSIAASLCCIVPVLTIAAGVSGAATTFAWLSPLRPYLIALTVLVLALAWIQLLRQKNDCCSEDVKAVKKPFIKSKKFLVIVSIFSVLMLLFPYISSLSTKPPDNIVAVDDVHIDTAAFSVSGMTCTACEAHIVDAVGKLEGITYVKASYEDENAVVFFDNRKTDQMAIRKAITSTGYKVID